MDVIGSSLNHTFPSKGNTVGNRSTRMPFLGRLYPYKRGVRPSAVWIQPNTSKRAPRGIYGASFLVGFDASTLPRFRFSDHRFFILIFPQRSDSPTLTSPIGGRVSVVNVSR